MGPMWPGLNPIASSWGPRWNPGNSCAGGDALRFAVDADRAEEPETLEVEPMREAVGVAMSRVGE